MKSELKNFFFILSFIPYIIMLVYIVYGLVGLMDFWNIVLLIIIGGFGIPPFNIIMIAII